MEASVQVKLLMEKTAFTEFRRVHRDRCKKEVLAAKIIIICIRIGALLIMSQLWLRRSVNEIVFKRAHIVNKELLYKIYKVI